MQLFSIEILSYEKVWANSLIKVYSFQILNKEIPSLGWHMCFETLERNSVERKDVFFVGQIVDQVLFLIFWKKLNHLAILFLRVRLNYPYHPLLPPTNPYFSKSCKNSILTSLYHFLKIFRGIQCIRKPRI